MPKNSDRNALGKTRTADRRGQPDRPSCRRRKQIWTPPTASYGRRKVGVLEPVHRVNRVEIDLIRGVDRVRDILVDNTQRFASGLPANNVLLWGARGMGKSSLVKAAHATINRQSPRSSR